MQIIQLAARGNGSRPPGPEEPSPSVEERLAALEAAVRQGLSMGGGEP